MTVNPLPAGADPAVAPAGPDDRPPAGAPDAVHADPVAEAFRSWMRDLARSGWTPEPVVETVPVRAARGRVAAADLVARWSVPAYRAAAMDGVAVADRDLAAVYPQVLGPEAHTWVDTGDPLSEGADRVVVREVVTALADGSVRIDEEPTTPHVRPVGEDMVAGDLVLPAGHRLRPVDVAAVAAAGYLSIGVRRRPRVAVVPTGDEIRPLGSTLAVGEILDTNSLMLEGLLSEAGCEVGISPVVPDAPDLLAAALTAAAHTADVVLVLAGSSAGRDDHTGAVIGRLGRVAVRGVAVRPGHPVVLGALGGTAPDDDGRPAAPPVPVVGVPGYPASAERVFEGLVGPLVRRILGSDPDGGHPVPARLAVPATSSPRLDEYLRVRMATVRDPATGADRLVAVPLPRGAGALSTSIRAEGVLRIPVGVARVEAGAEVLVGPVPGAAFAAGTTLLAGAASEPLTALLDVHRSDSPACVLHRCELPVEAALAALAAGLCHAAAVSLPAGGAHAAAAERLAARLGAVTVLEVARGLDRVECLVIPGAAFDSTPVVGLRSTLNSIEFRRRLRELPGWSGRTSGRERWIDPPAISFDEPDHADPAMGACACATR